LHHASISRLQAGIPGRAPRPTPGGAPDARARCPYPIQPCCRGQEHAAQSPARPACGDSAESRAESGAASRSAGASDSSATCSCPLQSVGTAAIQDVRTYRPMRKSCAMGHTSEQVVVAACSADRRCHSDWGTSGGWHIGQQSRSLRRLRAQSGAARSSALSWNRSCTPAGLARYATVRRPHTAMRTGPIKTKFGSS
jgi:hypothetical protein